MRTLPLYLYLFAIGLNISCFHLHLQKVPKKYINSIKTEIDLLAPKILSEYKSNASISVDSMEDYNLKKSLTKLKVQYITITYKFDTIGKSNYLQDFKFENVDSCIDFNHEKGPNNIGFDIWQTENTVRYFFGIKKPNIKNSKDEFSNLTRKINDSVYFYRDHSPPNR